MGGGGRCIKILWNLWWKNEHPNERPPLSGRRKKVVTWSVVRVVFDQGDSAVQVSACLVALHVLVFFSPLTPSPPLLCSFFVAWLMCAYAWYPAAFISSIVQNSTSVSLTITVIEGWWWKQTKVKFAASASVLIKTLMVNIPVPVFSFVQFLLQLFAHGPYCHLTMAIGKRRRKKSNKAQVGND